MTDATGYVFTPPPQPSLAITGESRRFAVRRIFCVGRNYADHAAEMGHDAKREAPFIFFKPADQLVADGSTIPYPPQTKDLQHEVELVVAIAKTGHDISAGEALSYVYGYGVGVDLTRRDLQQEAKDKKRPWDWGKGFDNCAPCSALTRAGEIAQPGAGRIRLSVNGAVKQDGDISQMIWPVPDIISFISKSMQLHQGDLIYTGTPAGVGPIGPGDEIVARIDGIAELAFYMAP